MKKAVFFILAIITISGIGFSEVIFTPSIGFSHVVVENKAFTINDEMNEKFEAFDNFKYKSLMLTLGIGVGTVKESGFTFMWDNYFSIWGRVFLDGLTNNSVLEKQFVSLSPVHGTMSATCFSDHNKFAKTGFLYNTNLLFGYSFRPTDKMNLNLTAGLGLGIGKFNITVAELISLKRWKENKANGNLDIEKSATALVFGGMSLQLGFQYYFVENVGLNIGVFDTLGFTAMLLFPEMELNYLGSGSTPAEKKERTLVLVKSFGNNFGIKIGPVIKIQN